MRNMKNYLLQTAFLMGAVTIAAVSAKAASFQMFSTDFTSTASTVATPYSITLPGFDPSLGTLNSATVTLFLAGTPFARILNFTAANGTGAGGNFVTGSSDYVLTLSGPDLASAIATLAGTYTDVPVGTAILTPIPEAATSDSKSFSASNLADYIGAGSVTFELNADDTDTGTQVGGPDVLLFGSAAPTITSATAAVSYDYTAAPEPGTFALMGLGLGAAVFFARRRIAQ
jgi:hypothetical protein